MLLLSMTFAAALAAPTMVEEVDRTDLTRYTFADYMRDFHKVYDADEIPARQSAFQSAMKKILEHNNAPGTSWKMGVSEHTDKTPVEWKQITTGRNAAPLAGASPFTSFHAGAVVVFFLLGCWLFWV